MFNEQKHKDFNLSQHFFLSMPFVHSEDGEDHKRATDLVQFWEKRFCADHWQIIMLKRHVYDHKAVIDRFGRYPNRNRALGRTSTDEEM